MLSASVASQIVFISTLKQTAGGWVSWSWVKEGEMKIKQIVYVQPGSIYLSIGAKTSSVRNIVVYETWLAYVTGNNSIRQISCFRRGKKFQGFISFGIIHTGDSHWLLRPRTNRRGRGRVTRALFCTQLSPALYVFDDTLKKLCIPQKQFNLKFLWFRNLTFPIRGIPWNRLSSHA